MKKVTESRTKRSAESRAAEGGGEKRTENRRRTAAWLLAIAMLLCGCGADAKNAPQPGAVPEAGSVLPGAMGRYREEKLSTEHEEKYPLDIFPVEEGVYLARAHGMDELLVPEGAAVEARAQSAGVFCSIAARNTVFDMAVAENGARMFSVWERGSEGGAARYHKYFLSADGQLREWAGYEEEERNVDYWYGKDGCFYVSAGDTASPGGGTALYRVDAQEGETEFLWEIPLIVDYISVCGDYLLACSQNSLMIYSLSGRERLPEDLVLSEAVGACREVYGNGHAHSWLAYGSGEGIYLLTEKGLFYHVMYGAVMEQIIEGTLCSIGDISKLPAAMCVTEGGDGEVPVFWLAYDSGETVRFIYDENVPSAPDTLVRIYSLYDDYNVRQAVAGYRDMHPELYLQYETGMAENSGQTREDALKRLAVQVALGDGPDVFVMDKIPYDAYVEKGVLKDLADIYEGLRSGEGCFENVVDCFYREDHVYAIPVAFQVTVLMGEEAQIAGVDSLEDFAALLEGTAVDNTSKAGLLTEERILKAMAMVSGGWTSENGELDREALGRFLEACRRIYLADRAGMEEENLQAEIRERTDTYWAVEGGAAYDFKMGDKLYCGNALEESYSYYHNPLSMGSLGGDIVRELTVFLAKLDYMGMDYRVMSHEGTACIPVSILAVNNASKVQREAEDFVKYVLGAEFQKNAVLSGIPVNRDALGRAVEESRSEVSVRLGSYGSSGAEVVILAADGISEEEFRRFQDMLERIDRAGICEAYVYHTVMELGAAAVNGEKSVEETVEAVAGRVLLYLAE